jgi:PAS domain S-box-containing protein
MEKSFSNQEPASKVKEIMSSSDQIPEAINELEVLTYAIADLKKTQDALRESEEKYRLLFSNVPLGILHFDSKGKITTCNDNFISIIDSTKEKITGAYLADIIDIHLTSAIENALAGNVGHYEGDFISRNSGKITPVRVNFAPIILDEKLIIGGVGIFEDITERKQIERIYFHDIINTAGNLLNLTELLEDEIDSKKKSELIHILGQLAKRIIDEINTHRHLVISEKSKINLSLRKIHSMDFIKNIIGSYNQADLFEAQSIVITEDSADIEFETDETILGRVLGNMIKNAVEASAPGHTVYVKCCLEDDLIVFSTHNSSVIPNDIQTQLFNRSISTKGAGRGLGIFSMKFLTEKYLGGQISFTSNKKEGTIFKVSYPLKLNLLV